MEKIIYETVVGLMFAMLFLISVTATKGTTCFCDYRPTFQKFDVSRLISGQPVYTISYFERFMQPYFYDESCPVITVELHPRNQVTATQKRFLIDPMAVEDNRYKWNVSLNYRTKGGKYGLVWMNETSVVFDVPLNSSDDWIQFNYDTSGMYRVNYDAILWDRITKQLIDNHTVFSEPSRSKLINDAAHLARAEHIGYDAFLDLLRYASEEKGFAPWVDIYHSFNFMNSMLFDTADFSHFQRYVLDLTSCMMDELQVKDEGGFAKNIARRMIMSLACSAGHKGCIENTTRLFKAWIQNDTTTSIPDMLAPEVYCIGIANSLLESDWNTVYERFMMATSCREKLHQLMGLACSRNLTMLERLLDYALDETELEFRYVRRAAFYTALNPASKSLVWKWLRLNSAKIDERAKIGFSKWVLEAAIHNLKTREQRQEVSDFLNNYPYVKRLSAPKYLHIIDRNIRWMDKNLATIFNWLEPNVSD